GVGASTGSTRTPAVPRVPSQRSAGRDLTSEVERDHPEHGWIALARKRFDLRSFRDEPLTELVSRQPGWGAPGRVVSPEELDRAIEQGWTQVWRGVTNKFVTDKT